MADTVPPPQPSLFAVPDPPKERYYVIPINADQDNYVVIDRQQSNSSGLFMVDSGSNDHCQLRAADLNSKSGAYIPF